MAAGPTHDAYVSEISVVVPFTARRVGAAVDLTGATLDRVFVQKPSGARAVYTTGLAVVSATAGTWQRTFATGELDESGTWSLQLQTIEAGVTTVYDVETKSIGTRLG